MIIKQISIIFLLLSLFFSGCSSSFNITQEYKSIIDQTSQTEHSEEDLDEFNDEFESEEEEESDPLRGYNIFMTNVNDKLYIYVLNPIATGYDYVMPVVAREGINNFFNNILYPVRFVNNVFQGKIYNAGEETGRFVINTTIGVLGIWDPAKKYFNLEAHQEDFGQTLGYWGVGGGYHIVLPFFGPSNMRDIFSMYPDSQVNPINYSDNSLVLTTFEKVNYTSLHLGEYESIKKDAVGLYPFLKDIYEQRRNQLIKE